MVKTVGTKPTKRTTEGCWETRRAMFDLLPKQIETEGVDDPLADYAEFGCYKGSSSRYILGLQKNTFDTQPEKRFHVFDSFKGLPEDWNWSSSFKKGTFALNASQIPTFPPPFQVHRGWFDATVKPFTEDMIARKRYLSFVHIDCDLYSSTKTVMSAINSLIVPGTVILFDEYHGYDTAHEHEEKAFNEWMQEFDRSVEHIAMTPYTQDLFVVRK